MHQVAGIYTQVIIRTKTTSVNPDPCVRWQAKIPQVVIRTNTTSVNPDPCVRWQVEIPQVVIRTNTTFVDPDPGVRWQEEIPQVVIRKNTTSVDPNPWVRWQEDIPKGYPHTHTNLLPDLWESGDMRRYLMVIRTFCQLEASKPVDTLRLTSSSAPFPEMSTSSGWDCKKVLFAIR